MHPASNVITLPVYDECDVHVSPGEYTAVYVGHTGKFSFRVRKVRVDFRLVEHPDLVIPRWYIVTDYRGGRICTRAHSDLTREVSAVLGSRVRPSRVPVGSLAGIYVSVVVRDVTVDRKQAPLHPVNVYSVIDHVIGRAL